MALAASALARPDGVGGHHGDHGAGHHVEHAGAAPSAPASSYGAPSTGYEQPAYEQSYEQPAYEQPAYDTPSTGYEQSYEPSYDEPASGYGTEVAEPFDPSMLIIPVLIIAGLALLFPQVVCVATNPNDPAVCNRRRKREAGGEWPGSGDYSEHSDSTQYTNIHTKPPLFNTHQLNLCLSSLICNLSQAPPSPTHHSHPSPSHPSRVAVGPMGNHARAKE
jgi:hypothetical protein